LPGLRLRHNTASPFVRMVMVLLHEAGLVDQVELVEAIGTPIEPGTLAASQNPLAKVPVLERADGPALYDSRVICRYLDDLAGGRFYPGKPRLWETLTLEATAHGITEAAVLIVYEGRIRAEAMRSGPWVEAQWGKIARGLDAVEARWMSHLAGPLDCAQIAMGSALGYLDFRLGDRDWRAGRPALALWEGRFVERASMQATLPAPAIWSN